MFQKFSAPKVQVIFVLILAVPILFSGLGKGALHNSAEKRCYFVVHEMIQTGDYMMPRYNGDIRVQKPPLYYWFVSGASAVQGGFGLVPLRGTSAVFGMATLLLLVVWGGVLNSRREAFVAILLLATTYEFISEARRGSFEMTFTFFTSACFMSCCALLEKRTVLLKTLACVTFGLAFLTKATPVFVYVVLPMALIMIARKQGRLLFSWAVWKYALIALGIGVSWYIAIMLSSAAAQRTVIEELLLPFGVGERETESAFHSQPSYYYMLKIWRYAFPTSLLLPLTICYVWMQRGFHRQSLWHAVLLGFLVPFMAFSMIPRKQDHYMLPSLVPLCLLTSRAVVVCLDEYAGCRRALLTIPMGIVAVSIAIFAVAGSAGLTVLADIPVCLALAAALVLLYCSWTTFKQTRSGEMDRAILTAVVALIVCWWMYFVHIRPVADDVASGAVFLRDDTEARITTKLQQYPILAFLLQVQDGKARARDIRDEQLVEESLSLE